jgi:YHS domain-containing protein
MFMSRLMWCSLLVVLALGIAGCKPQVTQEQNKSIPLATPAKEQPADNGPATEATADAVSPDDAKGLAELSVEDREIAKKQRICPVSGEVLGAMGKPFKTSVKGKTVFLCCEGCEHDLKDNPDKYLAKLKENEEKK